MKDEFCGKMMKSSCVRLSQKQLMQFEMVNSDRNNDVAENGNSSRFLSKKSVPKYRKSDFERKLMLHTRLCPNERNSAILLFYISSVFRSKTNVTSTDYIHLHKKQNKRFSYERCHFHFFFVDCFLVHNFHIE